ncbi:MULTISPECIES: molybdopterin-dependent oxidoreductase [unclassified Rhizobacter]|uniref:molybdopterin-dependent oxidoreductase n=1 Tax=unclassified Rhizobacter TaxID=2640088 RepID=UPI0009EA6F2F|nr:MULTISPECIES: molybdopterin-dependent oxidoreductase [unclassified Rhizobacter]
MGRWVLWSGWGDRRRAGLLLAAVGLCWIAGAARAADAPEGKPLLTIIGGIQHRNGPDGLSFDAAALQKLPQLSFWTRTPWYATPRKFTGVRLRDLLAAAGAQGQLVRAVALNDYKVDIPIEDAATSDVMVAWLLDDKPMPVRDKGPLVIIYPFDDQPELRTAVHYGRAVWQLRLLDIR